MFLSWVACLDTQVRSFCRCKPMDSMCQAHFSARVTVHCALSPGAQEHILTQVQPQVSPATETAQNTRCLEG